MPLCPQCGHKWYERNVRVKDGADLAAQVDERLAAFGDAAADVRLFLARARNARQRGLAVTLTIKVLEEFYTLHRQNCPAFAYALAATLKSENFDWNKNNLTGYLSSIFKSVIERGVPMSDRDKADRMATQMLGVWHRFQNISRFTKTTCGDLENPELVYRLVWALHKRGWLPENAPPHDKLAGHIREILHEKAARRMAIDPPKRPPRDTAARHVADVLPPEFQTAIEQAKRASARRERIDAQVWDEVK